MIVRQLAVNRSPIGERSSSIWRTINVSGRRSYLLPTNELLLAEEKGKVSCVVFYMTKPVFLMMAATCLGVKLWIRGHCDKIMCIFAETDNI
ncbi:MAG: hypothetical protein LBQ39_09605 [Tannerellaceae bacterium]|nr:hypothetical protein [Tannerellaceae bacterium]